MKHLKSYKLFESRINDMEDEIKDILIELEDNGLQIEMDRNTQSEFTIFTGQKQHSDEMVLQAQLFIEKNIEDKISIEYLSSKLNVGRRSFDRRFVKATGNTPIEYAQRVKIEAAKKAFETNRKTITEVMYEVGYTDVKAFREVFRKITGLSPLEYKRKYNKETF